MKDFVQNIKGKKVTVLGAARSGVAVATLLNEKGASVFLSEKSDVNHKSGEVKQLKAAGIESEFGGHSSRIADADLWVVSPGIPLSSDVLKTAKEKNISVFGELEVASWFCKSPIVAITGSNGKSTVTALLGEIFKTEGRPCVVAGNIGNPFSTVVSETRENGVAVLEVSSFQLETIHSFHPRIAVILNLTPDHLDRHGSMETYGKIKSRIFERQTESDFIVYNGKDLFVREMIKKARSQPIVFGVEKNSDNYGFVKNGQMILQLSGNREMLMPVNEMQIKGEHNLANGLAAALAARLMGVDVTTMRNTFHSFKGLPHRMEFIRNLDGVDWINDSKATNVDAVWYALGSYSNPVVLIAGGRDKDSDFTQLRKRLEKTTKSIILIGEAAEKMKNAFKEICPLIVSTSFEDCIKKAKEISQPGDVVLLSPGCASFDWFENFEDRGDQFRDIVNRL